MSTNRARMNQRAILLAVALLLMLQGGTTVALGQCQWLPGEGLRGPDAPVNALTSWDPDGPGPATPLLVAGGDFSIVGTAAANRIAAWDGTSWQPLGSGMNGEVRALAVFNGELIAAGSFTTAGGVGANRIARWNGTSWQPLGSGMNGEVRALTVFNGELIAGGGFTTAGGVTVNRIARWNGAVWQALGSGLGTEVFETARTLTVYDDELIAGGDFLTAGGQVSAYWARWGCPAPCVGDIDNDGVVGQSDLGGLLSAFGSCPGDPNYNPAANIAGDACIDQSDLGLLLANFGTTCP